MASLRSVTLSCSSSARPATATPIACSASTSGRAATWPARQCARRGRCSIIAAASGDKHSVAASLVAVLKDEIKYERESYRKEELILSGPPGEFELSDEPGTSAFLLAKKFGKEEIIVRVNIDAQPDYDEDEDEMDEYEDEEAQSRPVDFVVNIAKPSWGDDQVVVFECESDGEYLTIHSVSIESMDGDEEFSAPAYKGPAFQDLDDTLQQAFVDYLEERGVNAYLGEYIRVYLEDKARLEYQAWLGRMRDFIGK
ncbi:hypothetical protein CHLRE_04g225600v5 [Chlamydomonas reinhardtii]|uniref:Uncharacterized protein n=1 Tax=Chlamydomonas reinhardtii TaxID=3055 RepID=A8IT66_CHLRE|nr:uncharacterized protein CHLRE_04g225600v5 [Chlamydomonas reinhardtii]PNW84215.1 hypothetical protein CHLRE_04g225600v5 [Chlamydomonas reinhardtii]|eukprot:XP_001692320.1 predicted protein [Chlamydomonas reinhardtii]